MEKLEFYQRLKETLESDYFKEEIHTISSKSKKYGHKFLEKCLNFLISTREFDDLKYFINNMYNELYPYHYLKEVKGLNNEQTEKEIYNNYIRNGFLFHVTKSSNLDEILNKGLLTLNEKYQCNVYEECIRINQVYSNIREKNKGKLEQVLKLESLINVPGAIEIEKERFNTIYFSTNLEYILNTYGETGEFSGLLLEDIFSVFTGYYDNEELDKNKKIDIILNSIIDNKININEEELFCILDFIKKFSETKKTEEIEKTILIVPADVINFSSGGMRMLYTTNKMNLSTEIITDFNGGEVEHKGNIEPEDIIALVPQKDNTYKVKIKEKSIKI